MRYFQLVLIPVIFLLSCSSTKPPKSDASTSVDSLSESSATTKEVHKIIWTPDSIITQQTLIQVLNDSSKDRPQLYTPHLVQAAYKRNNYNLIWSDSNSKASIIRTLENAWQQGLLPEDYHVEAIELLTSIDKTDTIAYYNQTCQLDLLLTDAAFLYAYHMLEGKVSIKDYDPDWNYVSRPLPENRDSLLLSSIANHQLDEAILSLEPDFDQYKAFKKALIYYTEQEKSGTSSLLIEYPGKPLRLGDSSETVFLLKQYLVNYNPHLHDSINDVFDSELLVAVKSFQRYHGLKDDGIAGKETFERLNKSNQELIDQLRVNMERCRWLDLNLPDDYIIVNIAAYKLYYFRDNVFNYSCKVVVGKEDHETPIFTSNIQYIEFNPTWTVPHSIASKELLPKIQRDPNYLSKRNISVLKRNKEVDEATIDFSQYSEAHFPYTLRQGPGPGNALGTMKFIFPNKHSVYLHDTPSQYAFDAQDRTFSHGCVRVYQPKKLAIKLLEKQNVSSSDINNILHEKETKRVFLKPKLPVMLLYWTCQIDPTTKKIYYLKDCYSRDSKILKGLNARK